jgi:GNAT superfamily N-acetyltransferase
LIIKGVKKFLKYRNFDIFAKTLYIMQKYYLDTNIVYNIKKLSPAVLKSSFTSVFAVLEIITGIAADSYKYRKSVLKQLLDSRIEIDFLLPEELKFKCFGSYTENYDFIEQRTASLMDLASALVSSDTYGEYTESAAYNAPMGHVFFKNIDERISKDFIAATTEGTNKVREILGEGLAEQYIEYDGKRYDSGNLKQIGEFFARPEINNSVTILGLCEGVVEVIGDPELDSEKVFNSYNGLLSTYINVFSKYCLDKLVRSALPAKNDAADLTHICYLRNRRIKLVSDDAIYRKYLPNDSLGLLEVIVDADMELKELGFEDAEAYAKLLAEKDISAEFAVDSTFEKISASISGLNSSPDLAMTWGIFVSGGLSGFAQLCRKIDTSKTHEFEESDDIELLLDDEYQEKIRSKQLAVSPFTMNVAIGEDHRGKGYGKAAMRKLLELADIKGIKEVFLDIGHYNEHSRKMALSVGAELYEEGLMLNVYCVVL